MAKDPAFLFYSQDFFAGVATMNFEDRGKYITILCLMHQQGRMSEETICFLVGSVSVNLRDKFLRDENGLWYNKRLEEEIDKRNRFTDSRRANGQKGGRPTDKKIKPYGKHMHNHMVNHMEDENENENVVDNRKESRTKKFIRPDQTEVHNFVDELNVKANRPWKDERVEVEAKKFFNYYEANGWRVGRNPMKDWRAAVRNWMNNSNQFDNGKQTNHNGTAPHRSGRVHHVTPEEAAAALHRLHQERDARAARDAQP